MEVFEAAPDPTVIIDASARIAAVNRRVEEVLGYRPAELVGAPLTIIASVPGPDQLAERFRRYLETAETVPMGYSQAYRFRHADGRDVPMEISAAPIRTARGLLVSIALRDTTERLRLEAESERMRDELIATISHELRTPLTSIIGYTELMADLGEADLSERARGLLEVIERNATRELRLVDDLLLVAYLDDDRLRIQCEPTDLAAVCRRAVQDAALRAREQGVALTLEATDLAPVHGDFYRLVQVVENLLSNAIKFTEPGGRVVVALADGGTAGVVEVRDSGVGIPLAEQDRLFERLYRAPSAVSNHAQGAGLGLAIAKSLVEAHGGTIALESEEGVGTLVRVAIPYADPEAGPPVTRSD